MTGKELDDAILAAHAAGDPSRLCQLYTRAAQWQRDRGAEEAAAFLTVQAYVFALEAGDPSADALRARLAAAGREV